MAGVNGIWSNTSDYSYLFGTTNTSKQTTGNMLGIDLAEYSSITRGSYSKLIKAYYQKYGTDKSTTPVAGKDKESTAATTSIKGNADTLYKAADALVTTGKNSVFVKKDITDSETGVTTNGYDTDKIYKAVDSLVSAYNNLVKSSVNSTDNAVLRQSLSMIRSASANGSLLGDVGIKIGEDNTLSLDEETFKKADMSTVKSLLNGNDSFGGTIQRTASNIYLRANASLGNSNTYTAAGSFGSYSSGNILDSLL